MKVQKITLMILMIIICITQIKAGEVSKTNIFKEGDVEEIYTNIREAGAVYEWTQETVSFQNEGMNLVCTLVIPKTVDRPPIAITMNGFGENRYYIVIPNTNGEYFYERLSRILAEQGIATLRIDYRGSGDSDGTYGMTSFSTQASDALAAINFISTNKNMRDLVDWKRMGLVGFSQGGLVASIAASQDTRVDSLAIWSAVASPPSTYEYLLTRESIQKGISLNEGEETTVPVYIDGTLYGDITLGKNFFVDLAVVNPLPAITKFKGPLLYVAGSQDKIVWPQPYMGQMYLNYHEGFEKLVVLDTGHEFKTDIGPDEFDKTLYWTAAWFLYTL